MSGGGPPLSVGIIGASGYTGSELVRLLNGHPGVSVDLITSETHKGKKLSDVHPHLLGICDMELIGADEAAQRGPDLLFLALPHGVSMGYVRDHGDDGPRIVDLSGDFRLSTAECYTRWYKKPHVCPKRLDDAVYGLPELFRKEISGSRLVANPGCYPTSVILALAPLLGRGLVEPEGLIADSKSGITGAGARAGPVTHYPTANEDFRAYALEGHRHTPEMEQVLSVPAGAELELQFTPHLAPLSRGIQTTVYCRASPGTEQEDLDRAYAGAYGDEPFVRVRTTPPSVRDVRGSNYCDVHARLDGRTGNVIALSAIDNLVKGASGQAVQNMNIMLGLDERTGLGSAPLAP